MTAVADAPPATPVPDIGRMVRRAFAGTCAMAGVAVRDGDAHLAAAALAGAAETAARARTARASREVRAIAAAAMRRAERALGLTIRAGQAAGTIRRQGDSSTRLPSPSDIAGMPDLRLCYALADGVSDAAFEAAMARCAAQGSASHASVLRALDETAVPDPGWVPPAADRSAPAVAQRRKLIADRADAGLSTRQIAAQLGIGEETVRRIAGEIGADIRADVIVARTKRPDANRSAASLAASLAGLATAAGLIDPADLDRAQTQDWAASLADSLATLNRFATSAKDSAQ